MDVHKLADEARNSISEYCYTTCKAYCCRKGYIELDSDETKLFGASTVALPCPKLLDFKCTIYDTRPKMCSDFPLFIWSDRIHLSTRCPAVRENKFYPYVEKFSQLGWKVDEG